jgi:hypothetical protein
MWLRKFIKLEIKKVLGRRYIIIALIFLLASFYLIQNGISQYKHILEEKNNFQEFEATKTKYFVYMAQHGLYGVRMFFLPSPLMAIFNCGPVPDYMIAFYDSSERMKIYQPLIGQSAFSRITSVFMTFAGFILLFGSSMILLYGFTGSKDHGWLKFLEDSIGRGKLFIYQLISKTFILLLFCLCLAGLSMILFIINGVAMNPGQILTICLAAFVVLFCFLLGGLLAGALKNRFWGWMSMVIVWFVMAFIIPVVIYDWTYILSNSIKSPFKRETVKIKNFMNYERGSLEEGGKFDKSKYGDEKEVKMFLAFWNGDFKKIMKQETEILNEMKDRISFFQTLSAIFPSTFFLSINHEISSRGFSNLVKFNEYTQEKKREFIWFIADHIILNNKNEFAPFFEGDENVYQGQSRLPGNFNFGLAVTIIWIIMLLSLYWIVFNMMLNNAIETQRNLSPDELTKNQTNIIFTSDKGLLSQLIAKLRFQNIPFLSIPTPVSLPGDAKVKNLFYFFGLAVPETLQKIAGKYVYTLEPDQKGKVLAEITRSLKADVIIFNNFLAGLSDEIIHYFAGILKSLKKNSTIVYLTNSLMITAVICDPVNDHIHKWTKEQIAF